MPDDTLNRTLNRPLFSPSALQTAVRAAVTDMVPADKHGALVAVATTAGIKVAVAVRMGHGWEVMGVLDKPHDGPLNGAAQVVKQW